MDWQEIAAFAIVGLTLVWLIGSQFRRRKLKLGQGGSCPGCASAGSARPSSSVVFSARKGERPRVTLKLK